MCYSFFLLLTITKENPFQRETQPWGHGGTAGVWLRTAMAMAGPSQPIHLENETNSMTATSYPYSSYKLSNPLTK